MVVSRANWHSNKTGRIDRVRITVEKLKNAPIDGRGRPTILCAKNSLVLEGIFRGSPSYLREALKIASFGHQGDNRKNYLP